MESELLKSIRLSLVESRVQMILSDIEATSEELKSYQSDITWFDKVKLYFGKVGIRKDVCSKLASTSNTRTSMKIKKKG